MIERIAQFSLTTPKQSFGRTQRHTRPLLGAILDRLRGVSMPRSVVSIFPTMYMNVQDLETVIPRDEAENFAARDP